MRNFVGWSLIRPLHPPAQKSEIRSFTSFQTFHTHTQQTGFCCNLRNRKDVKTGSKSMFTDHDTHAIEHSIFASGCFEHVPTIDISKKRNMGNNTVTQHAAPLHFLPDNFNDNFIEDPMQIGSNTSPRKT